MVSRAPITSSAPAPSSSRSGPPDAATFKVYKPPNRPADISSDLPDSYFTPTPAELKVAQVQLSARTSALINAPLQVRAARAAKDAAKRKKWPTTTIRIRFTDRTQIEKTFPSTDTISPVYAFVHSTLREDVKPTKFVLYQSPPKRDFDASDPRVNNFSLAELQLAPSSVLLVRFEDNSLNASNIPAPLAPAVLSQAVDL